MISLYTSLITISLLYTTSRLWHLYQNYRIACCTCLPIIICPFDPDGMFYALFSVPLRPVFQFILPSGIFATVELSIWGWEFRDKAAIHEKLGPVFIFVTTGLNRLICADPGMAHHIMAKRRDFVHPEATTQAMGFLGANIVTAKDEAWSRQRRIVAPALNERISSEVWRESVEQASTFADILLSSPSSSTHENGHTVTGLRTIAMNVLARVAYGHRKPFVLHTPIRDTSSSMSYVDAIAVCTELLIAAAFIPAGLLRLPFMPMSLRILGVALQRLPGLTRYMLDQERQMSCESRDTNGDAIAAGQDSSNTIMSTLVHLSDHEKEQADKRSVRESNVGRPYLTEDEIAGNLFIFTAAGFDTTANTMSYAVALLATHPQWQTWIQSEIDTVLGAASTSMEPDYAMAFPMLTRCMAVMLETLRLFPPVTLLMRGTAEPQLIPFEKSPTKSLLLTTTYSVQVNTMALHTSPSYWGSDALEFKPARWLQASESGGKEMLITPPRGRFIPWSMGPRICPGQKMSQVEFVAVIATLFKKCNAQPMVQDEENFDEVRQRLLELMQDSKPVLTLQLNRPQDVMIRWRER
ncbi:cytochrome P450 [Phaeosphaeria sp. MPI-PUGE-AT-0046c]|nr:cytochrome P450 [Phaeosphaeria sp. MPI-PUGE-AT-0046c]